MMEHTTDRLFWTLTSIIVASLLMTLGIKIFPNATASITTQLHGVVQSADVSTKIQSPQDFGIDDNSNGDDNYAWGTDGSNHNFPTITNNTDGTEALARVNNLNDKVFQQQQEIRHYQDSLKNAVNHINDLNSRLSQVEHDKSQARHIDDLQQQILDTNSQMKTDQYNIDKLTSELSNNKDKLEAAQQQVQDLVAKAAANNDSLVQQLKKQGARIDQQNLSLAAYQSQAQQNNHELENLKNQLVQYKKSGDVNAQTVVDLQNQIKSLSDAQTLASNQATQAIADAINKINDANSRMDNQDGKINNNASRIDQENARQDTIQQLINTIQAQQGNDSSLISNLQKQLSDIKNTDNKDKYVSYMRDLTKNDDLNNIKDQGVYNLKDSNDAGVPNNTPSFALNHWNNVNGKLVVNHTQTQYNDTYFQTIYYTQDSNNQPGIAFRSFFDGHWTDWTRVADIQDLPKQDQPTVLTSKDDIYGINKPGVYTISNDHPKNSPNYNNEWSILVVNQTGMGVKGMIWYDYTGNMYFRYFDMNQHPWTKIATSDDMTRVEDEIQNAASTAATNTFNNNMYHLPAASDLNHAYTNSYFWPNTANKPDFGDSNANGPVLYAGTNGNGVQYTFQSGGNGHGFAWRSQTQGYWGPWQYNTSQNDIQNLQNQINDLRNRLNNSLVVRNSLKTYGTDFNNFTGTGIYPMDAAWATDWQNGPNYDDNKGPSYGRPGGVQLEVIKTGTTVSQTVTATNGVWQRTQINNAWNAWKRIDANGALRYQGNLDPNKSFNDYRDTGMYSLSDNQIPRDAPTNARIGTLEVTNNDGTIVQKFYTFENTGGNGKGWKVREYMRDQEHYQSWWNNWVEVATVDETQAAQDAANNAQHSADDANNKASDAQGKANDAGNKADNAQKTADEAKNKSSLAYIGTDLADQTRIKDVRTPGIYNLMGYYKGLPKWANAYITGQLVVYVRPTDSQGRFAITQQLFMNAGGGGSGWFRTITQEGKDPWQPMSKY